MSKRALQESRAVVTGASSGIGRALALALAQAGTAVLLVARREALLRQVADQIRRTGGTADVLPGDLADPAVRGAVVRRVHERWNGLEILVNNAGISAHGPFASAGPDRLRRIMELNFFAPVELIRESLPLLLRGKQPLIVNVDSILGHRGVPFNTEYCASKFALRGFSEALRTELTRLGVDVLVVSPGTTDTDFLAHLIDRQATLPWRSGRGVSATSVAQATVRAIRRGRCRIVPSWSGRMLLAVNRVSPWLVDRYLRRYAPAPTDQNCNQPK